MARLENPNGTYFDLRPISYQFPDGDDSLNWLNIKLHANDGNYVWKAVDPAFENFELTALIKWLRQLANNEPVTSLAFYATEPSVEFKARKTQDRFKLTVSLGYEFLPPPLRNQKGSYQKRVNLAFQDDGENILAFAADLEKELEPFPVRKERDDDP